MNHRYQLLPTCFRRRSRDGAGLTPPQLNFSPVSKYPNELPGFNTRISIELKCRNDRLHPIIIAPPSAGAPEMAWASPPLATAEFQASKYPNE